jgi:hypothetical protein
VLPPWLEPDRKSLERVLPKVNIPFLSTLTKAEKRKGNQGENKTIG